MAGTHYGTRPGGCRLQSFAFVPASSSGLEPMVLRNPLIAESMSFPRVFNMFPDALTQPQSTARLHSVNSATFAGGALETAGGV